MIKEKEVLISLQASSIQYYEDKGYMIPRYLDKYGNMRVPKNSSIKVKIEDISPKSKAIITAICTNKECKTKEISLPYCTYTVCLDDEIGLYYCKDCYTIKMFKLAELKQQRGELKRGQMYYWNFRENIVKETLLHIEQYGTVDNMPSTNKSLYGAIKAHGEDMFKLYEELGYDVSKLNNLKIEPTYEEILSHIRKFIDTYDSFPLSQDFCTPRLPITLTCFYKHWRSFDDLKRELNFYNTNDLRDKYGNTNKSLYEVYVANILFEWNSDLIFKRNELLDSKEGEYRSDFYIDKDSPFNLSGKSIHIEVFGYPKNAKDDRGAYYNYNRKIKEKIYKKLSGTILFIGIERKDVNTNYKNIQENVYKILSPYLYLAKRELTWNDIKYENEKSERDLLDEMMTYCNNDLTILKLTATEKGSSLYTYVCGKFGGIHYFIRKYNLNTEIKRDYWTEQILFESFIELINNHGYNLKRDDLIKFSKIDNKYKGIADYIYKEHGFAYWKVEFFKHCLVNNVALRNNFSIKDNLTCMIKGSGHQNIKPEIKLIAQELLDKYFNT